MTILSFDIIVNSYAITVCIMFTLIADDILILHKTNSFKTKK